MIDKVKNALRDYERLQSDRGVHESSWQDIAQLILPSRDFYNSWSPGNKRNRTIYDTTGMWANEQLSGGLHSMLTNPEMRWFNITIADPTFTLSYADRIWLDEVTQRMWVVYSAPSFRFASQAYETYQEISAFGNGCLYQDLWDGRIRFKNYPLSDCFIMENENGVVDTMFRRIRTTALKASRMFREKTPTKVAEKVDKSPHTIVHFVHVVRPRLDDDYRPLTEYSPLAKRKPFESLYIYVDGKELVDEGGYDEFPYMFSRFSKRSGEEYGYGPGGDAIHDVRMLNRMMEVSIRGAEKLVDPPILVPDDSVIGPLVINPAAIINYRPDSDKIEPLVTNARPDLGYDLMAGVRQRIIASYFINHLNLPQDNPQMTATEVLQRRDENMRLLGPMLSRQNSEFTGPSIERTFSLMMRARMLPPPPPRLQGRQIKIEYLSPIAQAQRFADLDAVTRAVQTAAMFAEAGDTMALQNFDTDEVIRYSGLEINKIPSRLMRSADQMNIIREQAAQAQAQAQQSGLAEQGSKSAKNLALAAKAADGVA